MQPKATLILAAVFIIAGFTTPKVTSGDQPDQSVLLPVTETGETEQQQGRPLAIVRRFNPMVVVRHLESDQWIDAERTHPLRDADTLRTDVEGFAVVQFMDNSVARVRPNSMLIVNGEVRAPGNITSRIAVEVGDMFLNISGINSSYEIATPSAVASVRGTEFSTYVDEAGLTEFTGFSGEVEIRALSSGQSATLTRGLRASVDPDGEEITLTEFSQGQLDRHFSQYDDSGREGEPRIMRLRFVNEEGEVEVIELEYFESDPDDE